MSCSFQPCELFVILTQARLNLGHDSGRYVPHFRKIPQPSQDFVSPHSIASLPQKVPQRSESLRAVVRQPLCLFEVPDGFVLQASRTIGQAQPVVCRCKRRVNLKRLVQLGDRVFIVAPNIKQ
jgi:hypothetical protein